LRGLHGPGATEKLFSAPLGPTAGAFGNAVARALGVRIRDLPLIRDRILAAVL
jgi:CO/xanthine dehydrogenase Mo-binding subunit